MKAGVGKALDWSGRRWWGAVLGLLGLQLGLLCWLGGRQPIRPRPATGAPQWQFAGPAAAEWLALQDPTLFVHGHARGFAGAGWMQVAVPAYQPLEPVEAPHWLALESQPLGQILRQYVQAHPAGARFWLSRPEPPLVGAEADTPPASIARSALRVTGGLIGRRMASAPPLPGWEQGDLLTNSVVRVLVDAAGQVVSPVLLASSGRAEADALALAVARALHFEPLPQDTARSKDVLCSGELVFEWQTLPVSPTNPPASQ